MSKEKILSIVLYVLGVLGIIGTSTFGYLYFKERASHEQVKNYAKTLEMSIEEKNSVEEEEESQNEIPEEEGNVAGSKEFLCSKWVYVYEGKNVPKMNIVYDNSEEVTFENVNEECTDIVMVYKGAKLSITYSHGEAYPVGFDEGTETVSLKKGLTVDGHEATLGRQKYVEKFTPSAQSTFEAGYTLDYVGLESEEACTQESEAFDTPGFPCYVGGNPFVTPAGKFHLWIPLSKSTDEIVELVEYFDAVAKNSSYSIVQ